MKNQRRGLAWVWGLPRVPQGAPVAGGVPKPSGTMQGMQGQKVKKSEKRDIDLGPQKSNVLSMLGLVGLATAVGLVKNREKWTPLNTRP